MLGATFTRRPVWLSVLIGAGFGAAGQLLIAGGLVASAGWSGPVVTLLAPAAVALVAALVIRAGWGATGYATGQVIAAQIGPSLMPSVAVPGTVDLVLSLAAGVVGYAVGAGILLAPSMPEFDRPSPIDLAKAETEARTQLRGIDPGAPGAFERATALLATVNQALGMYSLWSPRGGDRQPSGPPASLVELQAELAETARTAALHAGARRVTITMADGLHVEAIFGDDAPDIDEGRPRSIADVD
jgi:hypothetical protein